MRIKIAKKSFMLLLSLLLILSTGILAFASSSMDQQTSKSTPYLEQIGYDLSLPAPSLRDVNPINDVYYQSSASYVQSFTVNPSDGNGLNVYVENLDDIAATVDATVHAPDGGVHTVTLSPGQHYTWNYADSEGLSGTYKLVVSESTGDVMHIHVNARQYSNMRNFH